VTDLLELTVGPVAHGGFCVARGADGRVVFVRHALPGERVLARVTEDRGGSYCRADAVRVLAACPSPDQSAAAWRVPPACPEAGPGGCGGCDWQHAAPAAQLVLKAAVVREALARIAGLDVAVEVEPLPGGPLGWRTRVQLAVGPDGRAGLHEHRSARVVPLADCPLAVPGTLGPVLARRWPPGATVEVVRDGAGEVHVATVVAGRRRQVSGSGVAVQHAAGRRWRVPDGGFWQVHPAAATVLADAVAAYAAAPPGGLAWDLYGGVGLFAAVLAAQVGESGSVLLVESQRRAAADAAANLADLPQVRVRHGRVERVLPSLRGSPDVVVVDPPRRGLGRDLAHAVADRRPARVVHVACDPAALARDIRAFADRGYALAGLRAFDAFPMTHHVECVALLTLPGVSAEPDTGARGRGLSRPPTRVSRAADTPLS
jgi:tRNA/tmRNA/rRNA uracil-C5-methylase (TrmA/RlmC/RlmD family)